MSTGTAGIGFYDDGGRSPRTIDRPRPLEPEKPIDRRSDWERDVEENAKALAERVKRAQEAKEAEVARRNAEQQKSLKRGAFIMQDQFLIEDVLARHPLSDQEKQKVRQIIFENDYSAEAAHIEALKIEASKQEKVRDERIAAVRSRCDDAQWQDVLAAVDDLRGNISPDDLASGKSFEIAYNYLYWE